METTRWTNPTQPQTLQSSVILLYLNAAFSILFTLSGAAVLLGLGRVAAGWGCANERKWGYQLAVVMAVLPFVVLIPFLDVVADNLFQFLLSFAFDIVLLALLLHPQTRAYQRVWFR